MVFFSGHDPLMSLSSDNLTDSDEKLKFVRFGPKLEYEFSREQTSGKALNNG
jgi:hypothetical protein